MAVGQQVLGAEVLDVAELDRIAARLESRELDRSVRHAEQLVDVLALHRVYASAGMGLSSGAYLALLLSCSEYRAMTLLTDAQVMQRLGALDDMLAGLMTVEQARAVVDLLGPLDDALAASLWERLRDRLALDQEQAVVRPPARLRELLKGWLIVADPEGYANRRRQAAAEDGDVELWKRDDGLADLAGRALSAADAQACLDRIEQLAQPTGPDDERSAGQRRRDAFCDLLLGSTPLSVETAVVAQVFVHVPIDSALGEGGEPAELVGHGPVDGEARQELLLTGAVLHRVWVDGFASPVAVDDRVWRPERADVSGLQRMLGEMSSGAPPPARHLATDAYRPSTRQRRLVRTRSPRCEWPGCGHRSSRGVAAGCDLDHDLAWPYGPTCACNLART